MKKTLISLSVIALLAGCATADMAKKEAGVDAAKVDIERNLETNRNYVATAQGFSPAKTGRLASITLPRLGFEHSHIRH